ncbi:MAG: hypothetical protein JJU22_06105 [Gammaproteobacteria bacterium]|nr:hypothetical protein [Gammaproteobacteria bacterium]
MTGTALRHRRVRSAARRLRVLRAALAGCALILALFGCSGPPADVALEVLVSQQADFDGRLVRTTGTVREFDPPHHVWIEDAALNRVELEPIDRVESHVGETVTVTGRFSFVPDRGRRIRIEAVELAERD